MNSSISPGRGTAGVIAGALVATLVVGGTQLVVAATTHHHTIHACKNRSTGVLRVARHCTDTEKALTWNRRGPRGLRGARGPAGPVTAYGVSHGSEATIDADTVGTVAKLIVPMTTSGRYLVNASASLSLVHSVTTDASNPGECSVHADGTGTTQSFDIDGGVQTTTVALSLIATITPDDRVISLECGGAFDTGVNGASMTAVPLTN